MTILAEDWDGRLVSLVTPQELESLKNLPEQTLLSLYGSRLAFGALGDKAEEWVAYLKKLSLAKDTTLWKSLQELGREDMYQAYHLVTGPGNEMGVSYDTYYASVYLHHELNTLPYETRFTLLELVWNLLPLKRMDAPQDAVDAQTVCLPQLVALFKQEGEELNALLPLLNPDEYQTV